eukprot:TRINITY_DN7048_c0_g2_i7.p1 TRINITY_DN7048_c0_g2~~TRINITY_DN7048_c0_g2_i7.p1  ORF type:complete len:1314 (-),score=398.24 TRINITY_DN7048_c0_g2_i7:14-3955(-)
MSAPGAVVAKPRAEIPTPANLKIHKNPFSRNVVQTHLSESHASVPFARVLQTAEKQQLTSEKDIHVPFTAEEAAQTRVSFDRGTKQDLLQAYEHALYCTSFSFSTTLSSKRDITIILNDFMRRNNKTESLGEKTRTKLIHTFSLYRDISLEEEDNTEDPAASREATSFAKLITKCLKIVSSSTSSQISEPDWVQDFNKKCLAAVNDVLRAKDNNPALSATMTGRLAWVIGTGLEDLEAEERASIVRASFRPHITKEEDEQITTKVHALTGKELFLTQLRQRANAISRRVFYAADAFKSEDRFQLWHKQEEKAIEKLELSIQPREGHLKAVWPRVYALQKAREDVVGAVLVTVHAARKLVPEEAGEPKSEPFCELEVQGHTVRTHPVHGLEAPEWSRDLSLLVSGKGSTDLTIAVWDADRSDSLDKTSFYGRVKISLQELVSETKKDLPDRWYPLLKRNMKTPAGGELCVSIQYVRFPTAQDRYPNQGLFYRIIMERLVEAEVPAQEPAAQDPAPSSKGRGLAPATSVAHLRRGTSVASDAKDVVSPQASWILREYSERYGVTDLTSKVFYLDMTVRVMESTKNIAYIPQVRVLLKHVLDMTTNSGTALTMLEENSLLLVLRTLSHMCRLWFAHVGTTFPNNSPHGYLRMLVEIHYLVHGAPMWVGPAVVDNVLDIGSEHGNAALISWLEECYRCRYEQALILARTESPPGAGHNPRIWAVLKACEALQRDIDTDVRYYAHDFPSEVNLTNVGIRTYITCLSQESQQMLERSSSDPQELQDFIELYLKLRRVVGRFQELSPTVSVAVFPQLFRRCVIQWILNCAQQLEQWVDQVCAHDSWSPVSSTHMHSSSVVEVFAGCHLAMDFVRSLRWEGDHNLHEVVSNFAMVLSEIIIRYATVMRDICMTELTLPADLAIVGPEHKSEDLHPSPLKAFAKERKVSSKSNFMEQFLGAQGTPELEAAVQGLCVRVNNMEAVLAHTDDLFSALESLVDHATAPTLIGDMRNQAVYSLDVITVTIIEKIYARLNEVVLTEMMRALGIDTDPNAAKKIAGQMGKFFKQVEKGMTDAIQQGPLAPLGPQGIPLTDEEQALVAFAPLLDYLADKLGLLSHHMYLPIVRQLLKRLWAGTINDLGDIILPSVPGSSGPASPRVGSAAAVPPHYTLSMQQVVLLEHAIPVLGTFFTADGNGISQKTVDADVERVLTALAAYKTALSNQGSFLKDLLGLRQTFLAMRKPLKAISLLKSTIGRHVNPETGEGDKHSRLGKLNLNPLGINKKTFDKVGQQITSLPGNVAGLLTKGKTKDKDQKEGKPKPK